MPEKPERAASLIRFASLLAVVVALILMAAKFLTWLATGSVAVLSSLVDSSLDFAASGLNFFAVRHSLAPADQEHRFGHGKIEGVAGLAQASFVGGSAVFVIFESSERLIHPRTIDHGWIGVAVMVGSIVITGALVMYQRFVARTTGSLAISADAFHYETDLVAYLAIILALALSTVFNIVWLDPAVGIGIAIYMLLGSVKIGRASLDQLMDHEIPDADRDRIRDIALTQSGVESIHDLKTRSSGLNYFIQLHLALDGDLPLRDAHEISDQVEHAIVAAYPQAEVIVHQDPSDIIEAVSFHDS